MRRIKRFIPCKYVRVWLTNGNILEGNGKIIGRRVARYISANNLRIILIEQIDVADREHLKLLVDNRIKYLNADRSIKEEYYIRW